MRCVHTCDCKNDCARGGLVVPRGLPVEKNKSNAGRNIDKR
jgi:hypothetical protein